MNRTDSPQVRGAALAALVAMALAPACKRSTRTTPSIPYAGPPLGAASSVVRVARAIEPPRAALERPFDEVIALPSGTLGLAAGRLYRNPAGGATGAALVDALTTEHVRAIAAAGGDVVYALLDASPPRLARSDDGGLTWVRGATLGEGLPGPIPPALRRLNPEAAPWLAASGTTVVFAFGELAAVSRDGGATVAPLDLGGNAHSIAVTRAGAVVALVRLRPPPEGDPIGVVRATAAGVTRTALASNDACAPGRIYALTSGAVVLGSPRGLLGLCARISRDDGRTYTAFDAGGDAALEFGASPSGVLLRAHAGAAGEPAREASLDGGTSFVPLPRSLGDAPYDVTPDGAVAVGLADALARGPLTEAANGTVAREVLGDRRYALAFAAARDAVASMDPRGVVTVVDAASSGAPRLRRLESPCRFPLDSPIGVGFRHLALDGRGHICCTSGSGRGERPAACADLSEPVPAWRALVPAPPGVNSGDGRFAFIGPNSACVAYADLASRTAPASLGIGAQTRVRDLSCAEGGTAVAAVHDGVLTLGSPFELRAAGPRGGAVVLAPSVGLTSHSVALADGTVAAAVETQQGTVVTLHRAGEARALATWTSDVRSASPSIIAPWGAGASVLAVGERLVVVSVAGVSTRAFDTGTYEAVAHVGNALVGATSDGRFVVLEPGATAATRAP